MLRSCTDKEVKAGNRPCLNFHLKRCAGPCCGKISKSDYSKLVASADEFLRGRSEEVQKKLSKEMILASKEMNYELAASYRDRIKAISKIQSIQGINPQKVKEADIFALNFQSGQACVQVYFIRYNQNWGNRDYYPKVSSDMTKKEILEAFLGQFYLNRLPAKVILISNTIDNQNLLEKLFSEKLGKIVKIINPKKGEKKELVIDALRNAKEGLERKMAENSTQKNLLLKMADLLNLKNSPERIEVYDNSHIQGAYAVGAMVVSGPDGLMKSEYRKFNIKISELGNRDDTSMMQHVFSRRFKKKNTQDLKIPDVIILDGGKGQLSVIQNYLHDIGYGNIPIVAIAKGEKRNSGLEKFYHNKNNELEISNNDPLRYFLQRLRDEVHRYVIGAHRQKRSKSLMSTRLDEITGLGGIRRKNLLMRFGSTKEVSKASINELQKVQGISRNLAEQIYNFFSEPIITSFGQNSSLIATGVTSPFFVPLKLVLSLSFLVVLPYAFFELWSYVSPGLYAEEKSFVLPLITCSLSLFIIGIAFAFLIVAPLLLNFFISSAPSSVTVMTDISQYVQFLLKLVFGFGISFQVPVLTFLLVRTGITSKEALRLSLIHI